MGEGVRHRIGGMEGVLHSTVYIEFEGIGSVCCMVPIP
jgi:hypothetical protein